MAKYKIKTPCPHCGEKTLTLIRTERDATPGGQFYYEFFTVKCVGPPSVPGARWCYRNREQFSSFPSLLDYIHSAKALADWTLAHRAFQRSLEELKLTAAGYPSPDLWRED